MFSAEDKKDSGVSELDDSDLQALLDEAIAYKNPKDREHSSELFKELLAKVEADEREDSGQRGLSGIGGNGGRYRRGSSRRGDVSERNSRGGSLQNLVHALNSDVDLHSGFSNRKRSGRRNPQPQVSVSARQREGGSLPCNVNADFYGAAALLRVQDDVGTINSLRKRDHPTPIDDVVSGNSYSYKLSNSNSVRAVDDLSGYRASHSGKRTTDSLDDIETAAPRGLGNKRRELKKLGHSSDAIFPESTSDDICSMEDLSKEAERVRFADLRDEVVNSIDLCPSEFASHFLSRHNNVEKSSDRTMNEGDSSSQLNGLSILSFGMNGTVRPGGDLRWIKSETHKDDSMDGTEMTPIERAADISKYSSLRSSDNEVDQPILAEPFLPRKATCTMPIDMNDMNEIFQNTNFAGGDSLRSNLANKSNRSRAVFQGYQVSTYENNTHVLRMEPRLPSWLKDTEKKSFDENGNALHQGSGSERNFKKRKNKTDNNYVRAEEIPGHRGGTQDINELLLFIESPSNCQDAKSSVSGKNNRNSNGPINIKEGKQRNSSSNGKRSEGGANKVKSEKRKSNEKQKLKKSNSLEEISCTKLSDLTSENSTSGKGGSEKQPKKSSALESDASTRQSRQKNVRSATSSVSVVGQAGGNSNQKQRDSSIVRRTTPPPSEPVEMQAGSQVLGGDLLFTDPAEFHVVTKKQRKKKSGRSSSIGRSERHQHTAQNNNYHRATHSRRSATVDDSEVYHYRTATYRSDSPDHAQHQRRKSTSSMPPSDKSADSSDLDSVHSLPISSTSSKPVLDKSSTSTSSGSTPPASYADIARMASAMSPPQGQTCPPLPANGAQASSSQEAVSQGLSGGKWPSVGQSRLWTANVTLHTTTPLPASHEDGYQCYSAPVPVVSSPSNCSSFKRDAMTNTSQPESDSTDCSSVGNLLSDLSYPPLCESGKSLQTNTPQAVTQCVQTFISQASRSSPAISPGVTMANCVDVEDSAKRAASPAAFENVRENTRTSALDRPAVIILDEAETEVVVNGDPELTFGFEINEMLLSEETEARPQPAINPLANINLDKIVAFVGRAWEDVIKELPREAGAKDRVQFYNGQ